MGNIIARINAEMQEKPDDKYREIIGQYIIDRCEDPKCEEAASDEKKTLEGAMSAVFNLAEKARNGGAKCVALSPDQVFGEVDKYFGFPEYRQAQINAMFPGGSDPRPPVGVAVDLSDFL